MGSTAAIVIGGGLIGIFLLLVSVMLLQEGRARRVEPDPVWGIEDATDFVLADLGEPARSRLGRDGVRRVVEWQVYFLQQLARDDPDVPIVVGVTEGTVAHISAMVARQGHPMAEADIEAVLGGIGAYLVAIGVVGTEADPPEGL